jgi:Helicase associated domain
MTAAGLTCGIEHHGDARVPAAYKVDGFWIGRWAKAQRDTHAKGTLDADRQRRLQALPSWTWKASSSSEVAG